MSLAKDFRALSPEMRMAAAAAAALAVSLILPWYQKSYVPEGQREFVQSNVSAFGVFTFVEAAVLLVAFAVLFLVWARSQGKAFHLPGGDGAAITLAGGWALLLLVWRLFDKPNATGDATTVGIQWGIFGALLAAGWLVVAGARVRAAHRPEPPNPVADEVDWVAPSRPPREPRPDRRPREGTSDVFRERPAWEGDVGEPPGRARRDAAETRRMAGDDEAETRRLREDDAETRRVSGDDADAATRRFRDEDAETRRVSGDDADAATRRFRDEDAETRRMSDDDAETRRFRDDDARTRRLPRDDERPPSSPDAAARHLPPPDQRPPSSPDAAARPSPRDEDMAQRLWDDEERTQRLPRDDGRLWSDDQ